MRHIELSNMGIIVECKIFGNKAYIRLNNALIRPLFKQMLVQKGIEVEEKDEWLLFEVKDKHTEKEIGDFLLEQFKVGGWQVVKDQTN